MARGAYCKVGSIVMAEGSTGTPVKDGVSKGWGKEGLEQTVAYVVTTTSPDPPGGSLLILAAVTSPNPVCFVRQPHSDLKC